MSACQSLHYSQIQQESRLGLKYIQSKNLLLQGHFPPILLLRPSRHHLDHLHCYSY